MGIRTSSGWSNNLTKELYTGSRLCENCGTTPHFLPVNCGCERLLCVACICEVCNVCDNCCECGNFHSITGDLQKLTSPTSNEIVHELTDSGINLYCIKCSVVTEHIESSDSYIWCNICLNLWNIDDLTLTELTLEGTDSEWLDRKFPHKGAIDETEAFCGECKKVTTHTVPAAISVWICSVCKYFNPNVNKALPDDSPNTIVKRVPRSAATSDYNPSGYGYAHGDYRTCAHWRSPVKIGKWTVLASASFDKGTPAGTPTQPDYGVYLATTWSAGITCTPDFPTAALDMPTQYPAVFYDWTDMAAPRNPQIVGLVTWMVNSIKDGVLLDIGCMGAHGRTGTLLAMLLVEIEGLKAQEAIDQVRERHCKNAIETLAQEDYIFGWAGEPKPVRKTIASESAQLPLLAGAPAQFTTVGGFEYKNRKNNGTTWPTDKQGRQALKKLRRERRLDWKETIQQERATCLNIGTEWSVYRKQVLEPNALIWECLRCATVDRSFLASALPTPAKKDMYCRECKKYGEHQRPRGLD